MRVLLRGSVLLGYEQLEIMLKYLVGQFRVRQSLTLDEGKLASIGGENTRQRRGQRPLYPSADRHDNRAELAVEEK